MTQPYSGSILGLYQQAEIRASDEDWTGLTDPVKRRKLQNRLHQRAWICDTGRRQAKKWRNDNGTASLLDTDFAQKCSQQDSICTSGATNAVKMLIRFEAYARHQYQLGSPRTDMLLTLIKFNVFRALMDINGMLGFSLEWLREDAISPFYQSLHDTKSGCPGNLEPTLLQQTVEHHPWIDLIPLPAMRDNILRADSFDDTPLCHDIVDNRQCLGDWSGLIVWGDPWDPHNWEASEDFVKKWAWVVHGCWELFGSTNKWRSKRGERKLFPDDLSSPLVF